MHLCTLEGNDKNVLFFFLYVLHDYSQDLLSHINTHAYTRTHMQLQAKYLENMYAHTHTHMYTLRKHVWVAVCVHVYELCACVCVTN